MTITKKRMPARMLAVDLERCLACKSCEMACAKAHAGVEDVVEAILAGVRLIPRVRVVVSGGRAVPVRCHHCVNAPCVKACPSGALYQDEERGMVSIAPEKCTGSKKCVSACPFGAVYWDSESESVIKCDLCQGIIKEGEQPACVVACPTGALRLVERVEVSAYRIDSERCICCGRCARDCPVQCITGKKGKPPAKAKEKDKAAGKVGVPFKIDQDVCIRCGACFDTCPVDAVNREN